MIIHHQSEMIMRRKALQVDGQALKGDREALKDTGEALKGSDEALIVDPEALKGTDKGKTAMRRR